MKTVFIYALCEPGTRTVRYIGQTTSLKRRFRQHLNDSPKLDSPLGEWMRSLSAPPTLVKLCETSEAFWEDDEKVYIRSARVLGMPLLNVTEGGAGVPKTPEICAKLSATKSTPEAIAKVSAEVKARWADPEFHQRACEGMRASVDYSPEGKARRSEIAIRRASNPESKVKAAATRATPEFHQKSSNISKLRWADEAERAAQSERLKAAWSNPETRAALDASEARARQRAGISAAHSRPESRAKRSTALKAKWADPVWRTAMMEARKIKKTMRAIL